MANLPLAFAELLGGGVLLTAGVSGSSVYDVFAGDVSLKAFGGGSTATAAPTMPATGDRQGAVSKADLRRVGRRFGWSGAQIEAWWQVIQQESGGDPKARNPKSGAFGIGQFLGSTKDEYAPYGATSSDPMQQLYAMAKYIHDRYGTPEAALAFHQAHGWY
jgi:hypothetical protein